MAEDSDDIAAAKHVVMTPDRRKPANIGGAGQKSMNDHGTAPTLHHVDVEAFSFFLE